MHSLYTEINCPILERPNNGRVTLTGTVIGARAIYSCEDGFALEGSSEIACGNDGLWVDDPPVCSGKLNMNNLVTLQHHRVIIMY